MKRRNLFSTTAKAAVATAFVRLAGKEGRAQTLTGPTGAPGTFEFLYSHVLPVPSPPFAGMIMPNFIDSTPAWPPR